MGARFRRRPVCHAPRMQRAQLPADQRPRALDGVPLRRERGTLKRLACIGPRTAEERTFDRRERRAPPSVSSTRSRTDRRRSGCVDGAPIAPCLPCTTARYRANENILDKVREGPSRQARSPSRRAAPCALPDAAQTPGRRLPRGCRQPDDFEDLPIRVRRKNPGKPDRPRCAGSRGSATNHSAFQVLRIPLTIFASKQRSVPSLFSLTQKLFTAFGRRGLEFGARQPYTCVHRPKGWQC